MDSTVERFCARKDIYHCLVAVVDGGEGGMLGRIKKGILNPELVQKVAHEEVGTACVASGRAMRSKHGFKFFTVYVSNFCIDISADD